MLVGVGVGVCGVDACVSGFSESGLIDVLMIPCWNVWTEEHAVAWRMTGVLEGRRECGRVESRRQIPRGAGWWFGVRRAGVTERVCRKIGVRELQRGVIRERDG